VSRLRLDDVRRVGDAIGDPARVTTTVASGEVARVGARRFDVNVNGTNENLPRVFDRTVARGGFFSSVDVEVRRRVAVLGADPAEALFPDRDPLGKSVTIGGVRFRVVGVLSRVGNALGVNRNLEVFIPVTAAQRLFGVSRLDAIAVKAASTGDIDEERRIVQDVLGRAHPEQDYQVLTQEDILGVVGRILNVLTLVLASIAGISLVVGGVGVMNIMLVSVSERTREIGLRKAVGARTRDVLRQFLLEAVALTVSGGIVGILVGVTGALLVARFSPVPAAITAWSVALAFGVSVAVGVFFGVYPARKAARMQPIAALRYE
jgi:putative ABC transport system permease protein